jgi:hypothetical protein
MSEFGRGWAKKTLNNPFASIFTVKERYDAPSSCAFLAGIPCLFVFHAEARRKARMCRHSRRRTEGSCTPQPLHAKPRCIRSPLFKELVPETILIGEGGRRRRTGVCLSCPKSLCDRAEKRHWIPPPKTRGNDGTSYLFQRSREFAH